MKQPRTAAPWIAPGVILLLGILFSVYTLWQTYSVNGSFGFPLDDPWIHLQFARNLAEHGVFSYYENELVTSGSTSPLYTMLLSLGLSVTDNEMVLSYTLGMSFLALGGLYFFRFTSENFGHDWKYALAGTFLMLSEPRLQWVSLSGMETTLFIFLLLAAAFHFRKQNRNLSGVFAGLLVWARPEALLFVGVLGMEWFYETKIVERAPGKTVAGGQKGMSLGWIKKPLMIFGVFVLVYVTFNLVLSGTVFPNTFAAKIKYYSAGGERFLSQILAFATGGHLAVFWIFVVVGIVSVTMNILKRKPEPLLGSLLWSVGLSLAYWIYLPYLFQEGRYLMPVIPFLVLIGLRGIRETFQIVVRFVGLLRAGARGSLAQVLVLLVFCIQFGFASWKKSSQYAEDCKYIADRQVMGALWMRDNLPGDAVIATHDIGAIAFYSERRIFDMVGLVSPEMIEQIGDLGKLREELIAHRVTHVAVLRSWFEVDNQDPLFRTDERFPEVMEVFLFDKERTHFVPGKVPGLRTLAWKSLTAGNLQQAEILLREAIQIDRLSSRSRYLLGLAYLSGGRLKESEVEIRQALNLRPNFPEGRLAQAEIAMKRGDTAAALAELEAIVRDRPAFAPAYLALSAVYRAANLDSTKASEYLKRYHKLSNSRAQ